MWIILAFGSALCAGLTSILAKCGIKKTDSNVATAIRTIVVLVFSWLMVFIIGSQNTINAVPMKTWLFLILSGLATGASWLCYFRALQLEDINKVVPIDKSSTILALILAFAFLGEKITLIKGLAICLIGIGTYLMIAKKKVAEVEAKETVPARDTVKVKETATAKDTVKAKETALVDGNSVVNENNSEHKRNKNKGTFKYAGYVYAVLSAVFASLTAILGKVGIDGIESNLGTAVRTCVVLVMAWIVVFVSGKAKEVKHISRKEMLFICLSGVATGGSWLCYYRALKDGMASVVVPIDKLSILVSIAFSYIVFKEKMSLKAIIGLILIVSGTLLMLIK